MKANNLHSSHQLPSETINAMNELALVLADIYQRMKQEGYRMEEGIIIKPQTNECNA